MNRFLMSVKPILHYRTYKTIPHAPICKTVQDVNEAMARMKNAQEIFSQFPQEKVSLNSLVRTNAGKFLILSLPLCSFVYIPQYGLQDLPSFVYRNMAYRISLPQYDQLLQYCLYGISQRRPSNTQLVG